jgi:formylmethanofuran dehydrogenase subunit E
MKTKGRFGVKIPAILIVFALMCAIMVMPASATGEHDKGTISVANRATGDGQITVEGIADKCVFKDKRVFKVVVEIKKGMSPWEATQEIAKALNENAQFEKNYIARHSLEKPDVIITEREEHSAAFKLKITEMDKVESQIYYTTSQANITVSNPVGRRAAEIAKEELSFVKDDPNILAMTDAGYAIVGGKSGGTTTEACIDGVTASAGCTIGNGNLLLIHRSKEKPLWFAFFNNASGECVYLEVDNSVFELSIDEFKALPDEEVFTTIAKANIGADELFANPESWPTVFGGNEFSIITIANVWAKGAPYEFLKAAEFHNHICPGLTSGYIIIEYLDENLPLQGSQNYEIIACPPWCKDDAFQVIFDKTVGKLD